MSDVIRVVRTAGRKFRTVVRADAVRDDSGRTLTVGSYSLAGVPGVPREGHCPRLMKDIRTHFEVRRNTVQFETRTGRSYLDRRIADTVLPDLALGSRQVVAMASCNRAALACGYCARFDFVVKECSQQISSAPAFVALKVFRTLAAQL